MTYRIYTEDINREGIEKIVNKYRDGYTLILTEGIWQGKKELSLIIEIVTLSKVGLAIQRNVTKSIAKEIKELNKQQVVLVIELQENSWLI